ncbi:fructose-bisphosphate aldolase [Halenospora varia]|nr:fructose-bisphosphate aldolase [Halenospora varia]
MSSFPENNRTWQILHGANKGNYAVGAYNCYNTDGVMAVIRAAENKKSPAIIQLFPWTLHFQGKQFVKFVIEYAHNASVPIAVHLDHCIQSADVDLALSLSVPFDSIMVDASTLSPEENIRTCKSYVERATALGICIEAEMGRMEGGEDGLPHVDMETILTKPDEAETFVRETGVHFLAPSFGNIHGAYGPGGAEKAWDLERLKKIHEALPGLPLALHGTHPVSDELFLESMKCGMRKINLNRTVRDGYTQFVAENAGKLELTVLSMRGVEIYTKGVERMMDVLGSSGKA